MDITKTLGLQKMKRKLFMYAMCGKLIAQPGKRETFTAIMLRAAALVGTMPGCKQYVVTHDAADDVTIWIMEIWEDQAAHDASLQNEGVRALIAEAMPLMGGEPDGAALTVVGGHGI
jgi:quinol monooxygenase YgiN